MGVIGGFIFLGWEEFISRLVLLAFPPGGEDLGLEALFAQVAGNHRRVSMGYPDSIGAGFLDAPEEAGPIHMIA